MEEIPAAKSIVPEAIRKGHEAAYDPKVVSIGPYHRGKENLQAMEERKWQCLRDLFSPPESKESALEKCLKKKKNLEANARRCYPEDLSHIGSNDFVEMMLLDGCFFLQYFRKHLWWIKMGEQIFSRIWMPPIIYHDLLLVENQLPFFILSSLFELLFKDVKDTSITSAKELLGLFFEGNEEISPEEPIHHLLHFLHMGICPAETDSSFESRFKKLKNLFPTQLLEAAVKYCFKMLKNQFSSFHSHPVSSSSKNQSQLTIPSATELQRAGVRFKKRDTRHFLDIKFRHGVMEIPSFLIHQRSDSIFRNLITLEQFHIPNSETYVIIFPMCLKRLTSIIRHSFQFMPISALHSL